MQTLEETQRMLKETRNISYVIKPVVFSCSLKFYITPKWDKLLEFDVWYAAVTQSFFSLSVGSSSIITLSSYNNFRHNTYRDAIIISVHFVLILPVLSP